jgi:hypothetical protein
MGIGGGLCATDRFEASAKTARVLREMPLPCGDSGHSEARARQALRISTHLTQTTIWLIVQCSNAAMQQS